MTFIPSTVSMALVGRAETSSTEDESNTSLFRYFYFIVAIILVFVLMASRLYVLRRRNQSVTDFFSVTPSSKDSQVPGNHAFGSSQQSSRLILPLATLPSVYRTDRRVRAADTDGSGRRLGGSDSLDWDGKDTLPAYDSVDRPPKYNFGGGDPPPTVPLPGHDSGQAPNPPGI